MSYTEHRRANELTDRDLGKWIAVVGVEEAKELMAVSVTISPSTMEPAIFVYRTAEDPIELEPTARCFLASTKGAARVVPERRVHVFYYSYDGYCGRGWTWCWEVDGVIFDRASNLPRAVDSWAEAFEAAKSALADRALKAAA